MRVLVIGAHPDDETLGVGGTIARLTDAGAEVTVGLLTDGVGSRHGKSEQQIRCARRACEVLGVSHVELVDLPDQGLDGLPLIEVIRPIETLVERHRPRWMFVHAHGDANQDHRVAFEAALVAARPLPDSPVRRLLAYETLSSSEWGAPLSDRVFRPNVYVDISDVLSRKIEALRQYEDTWKSELREFPHPRSLEAVEAKARTSGSEVGVAAAERFMLLRERLHVENILDNGGDKG